MNDAVVTALELIRLVEDGMDTLSASQQLDALDLLGEYAGLNEDTETV